MKKCVFGIAVLLITSWLVTGCKEKGKDTAVENSDSISSVDSVKALTKNQDKKNILIDKSDADFILNTLRACATETALGNIAITHAENKRVRNFGHIMVKDIARAKKMLDTLAENKGLAQNVAPDGAEKEIIGKLSKKYGRAFDKAYVDFMITDHQNYIKSFEDQSKNSGDPDVKAFATKALRSLKTHLDAIDAIHDSMKQ